jgi:hypothetical protein
MNYQIYIAVFAGVLKMETPAIDRRLSWNRKRITNIE